MKLRFVTHKIKFDKVDFKHYSITCHLLCLVINELMLSLVLAIKITKNEVNISLSAYYLTLKNLCEILKIWTIWNTRFYWALKWTRLLCSQIFFYKSQLKFLLEIRQYTFILSSSEHKQMMIAINQIYPITVKNA